MTQQLTQAVNAAEVDEALIFTAEQWQMLPFDLDVDEQLNLHQGKPPLPADTDIQQIRYYIDGRLGFSWDEGEITHQIYLPESYQPKSIIHEINGEIVGIQVNNETVIDRSEKLNLEQIEQKNIAVKKRLGIAV